MREWQPLKMPGQMGKPPFTGEWVLTIGKNGGGFWTVPAVMRWNAGGWETGIPEIVIYHQPTHWMPLPADPPPTSK